MSILSPDYPDSRSSSVPPERSRTTNCTSRRNSSKRCQLGSSGRLSSPMRKKNFAFDFSRRAAAPPCRSSRMVAGDQSPAGSRRNTFRRRSRRSAFPSELALPVGGVCALCGDCAASTKITSARSEALERFAREDEMTVVNRIETAAVNANFFQARLSRASARVFDPRREVAKAD